MKHIIIIHIKILLKSTEVYVTKQVVRFKVIELIIKRIE